MIKEVLSTIPFTRRKFLLGLGAVLVSKVLIEPLSPKKASAYPLYDIDSSKNPEISQLEKYLKRIEPERKKFEAIVAQIDLFDDFKKISTSQRIEDFNMYFPMYKAGEIQYGIPWFLLWIIHVHETTVSWDKNPDEYHKGAFQRLEEFSPDEEVEMAAADWGMLRDLPQRYCPRNGWPHFDCDETLWAASYLKRRAREQKEINPSWDDETCLLEAVKNYCALKYGEERVARYWIIKETFEQSLKD
jgi:hypothetical protein